MTEPTFTTGDTAPDLTGTVNTDLTGATVELHFKPAGADPITVTPTVTDAPSGAWSYSWAVGDLASAGRWSCEIQVTYANGRIQTFGPQYFQVTQQIS